MDDWIPATIAAGPRLVGLVLMVSSLGKILDIAWFDHYLSRLVRVPARGRRLLAIGAIGFESSFGVALFLAWRLEWLIPAASVVLLGFAALTWWSVVARRVESCGCYAGVLEISPRASAGLDLVYIALLWSAWPGAAALPRGSSVVLPSVIAAGLGGAALAAIAHAHDLRTGRPLLYLGPLRAGRHWRRSWLPEPWAARITSGTTLVIFMSPACGLCKRWLQVLNVVHGASGMPVVLGFVAAGHNETERTAAHVGARFPVTAVEPGAMRRLTRGALPTVVIVRDGKIAERWIKQLPAAITADLRHALFAQARVAPRRLVREPDQT